MNKQEFFDDFYNILEPLAKDRGGRLERIEVKKNNRTLSGITVRFGDEGTAPTFYPELYMEEVKDREELFHLIKGAFEDALKMTEEIGSKFQKTLSNREELKENIRLSIVGYEQNKEMLKDLPYERVEDLAVYARIKIGDGASAAIRHETLDLLKLTKEEVLALGKRNMEKEALLKDMNEIIADIFRSFGTKEQMTEGFIQSGMSGVLYLLSTKDGRDGAALISSQAVLKEVYGRMGEDFYILPSSVDEVLITPKSKYPGTVEELDQMVFSINRNDVLPEQRLSDRVYQFDGHKLSIAGEAGIERDNGIADRSTHKHSR